MTPAQKYFAERVAPYIDRLRKDLNIGEWDAVAIMGNAGHECLGFTALQELKPTVAGSRGGYGWMQWTGPRRRDYEAFCKSRVINPAHMESNYLFLVHELTNTFEKKALSAIYAVVSLDDKVETFEREFLRAGVKQYDSRKRWARIALTAYDAWLEKQGTPPVSADTPPVEPRVEPPVLKPENSKTGVIAAIVAILTAIGAGIMYWIGK